MTHVWAGLRRGRRPAREPSAPRAWLGASTRCPARPRRRPRAPQPGLRSSGALHAGGACAVVSHLEARLGSAAHGHRSQACVPPAPFTPAVRLVLLCVAPSCLLLSNFARNSPVTISEFELASLELQRFWAVFKSDRGKLRATFVSLVSCHRPWAPQPGPSDPPVPCTPAVPARLCLTSKPGQAPLPTGTAAWSTRLLCVQHFRT